ncbi:MAG: hypothetical protein H7Y07_00335 [Pyrinomonadaceae bacterium]|nr:hypothetical protein [Sphingobacteriaceae bacterium]
MKKINFKLNSIVSGIAIAVVLASGSCKKQDEQAPLASEEAIGENAGIGKNSAKTLASGQVVRLADGRFQASVNGVTRYTGTDYIASINAAITGLTPGRTTKEWITIRTSGTSGDSGTTLKYVSMASYTGLDFTGATMTCNSSGLYIVPIMGDRKTDLEIKNFKVAGTPRYCVWFRGCNNMRISNVNFNISSPDMGLGLRIDNSTASTRNLTIDGTLVFKGGDNHIETVGVDGFTIGNVTSSNNRACGVLLNTSKNGTVGTVTGSYNSNGGGYATFRVANNNGPNVRCAKVYSRNSGRGFFSVSGSGGTTVTTVDIANNTGHGILLQNAYDTFVNGGTVSNSNRNIQHDNATNCRTVVNGRTYTAYDGIW